MNTKELQKLTQLYNAVLDWVDDSTVGWQFKTDDFKRVVLMVKHHNAALKVMLGEPVPLTIEEKVARAVFYVEDNITYRIVYSMTEEGYFIGVDISDENCAETHFDIDSIPADAYFLGTHKL